MIAIERLIAAGVEPNEAVDTDIWFHQQGNEDGLERYVREVEKRAQQKDVQALQSKPPQKECF